jgi:hypothetical protein
VLAFATGFHDVDYHSGEPYDLTDWPVNDGGGALTWACTPHAVNPNANALRWGTLYNFRFDADSPPVSGIATLALFRPGTPAAMTVEVLRPADMLRGDLNCDGQVNDGDVAPFVLALTDPAGYAGAYPGCNLHRADLTLDLKVDGQDVAPFVACVLSTECP